MTTLPEQGGLRAAALLICRYASFYLTRNSLAFTAPTMLEDKALGLDMTAVGGLTSILPVAYGFSKFLSGVLGARTSPRILLAGGLAATALVNIAFGMSSAYPLLLAFWGLNGILQVRVGGIPANPASCDKL